MLSYIPEPTLPHPRVKAVRQVAEDLMESSESQEESGSSTPKPRKYKVTSLFWGEFNLAETKQTYSAGIKVLFTLCRI